LLYILYGPDDYSIAHELDAIKQSAGDASLLATNTTILNGVEVTVNDLRVACETVPFLADKRLVIVYSLMERFAPRQSPRTTIKKHESQLINYEVFGDIIKGIPPSTILVLIENELKESNPLFKIISGKAQVKAFPMLKAPQLREWITNRLTEEGGNISPSAITLLTRLIGSNLWIMSGELKKLALYANGRRIEEKDVKVLVSYSQQSNVFAMVDAIFEFSIQKAETMLQQLLSEGNSPTQLLTMLNRQMRLIVRARELKQQRLSETEIRGRLGLTADWLVRKTLEQANRYTLPRIKQVYQQLLETDIAIKTGKYDGELALNILIAELCQPQKFDASPRQIQGVAV
jgi:DNA polymerase-3 subunit delta